MPILTFAAIDADPRNAVTLDLPDDASLELLELAYAAATACAEIEDRLMMATRQRLYVPDWWKAALATGAPGGDEVCDVYELRCQKAFDRVELLQKRLRM